MACPPALVIDRHCDFLVRKMCIIGCNVELTMRKLIISDWQVDHPIDRHLPTGYRASASLYSRFLLAGYRASFDGLVDLSLDMYRQAIELQRN